MLNISSPINDILYFSHSSIDSPDEKNVQKEKKKKRGQTLPTTDADMLEAGSSFLDAIEKSLGLGYVFDIFCSLS